MRMNQNPIIERPDKSAANQAIQQGMKVSPAVLANGKPGVALKLGALTVCISAKAAMNHANKVADAIEYHKGKTA